MMATPAKRLKQCTWTSIPHYLRPYLSSWRVEKAWDADPINSMNFEFEPPEASKALNVGRARIEKIIQEAQEDRYTTKKTAKQLEYGHGVAGTRYLQQLWTTRFDTFRKHTLQKSSESTPSGDDILRFFDGIIDKLGSKEDKPAPSLHIIVR